MFAIIDDGSHQVRVQEGDTLTIDFREGAETGQAITFDRVLLANGGGASKLGKPTIAGASVTTTVVEPETKGEKLEIQRFRRRKNMRKHTGHRQKYTTVKVTSIKVPGLEIVEQQPVAK